MEVSQLIRPPVPPVGVNRSAHPGDSPLFRPEDAAFLLYPSFSTPQVAKVTEEGEGPSQVVGPAAQGEEPNVVNQVSAVDEPTSSITQKGTNVLEAEKFSDVKSSTREETKSETLVQQDGSGVGSSDTHQQCPPTNPDSSASESATKIVSHSAPVQIVSEDTSDTESGIHSRSGMASSMEGRTPVLAASSGEATPMYRDQTLQSMARETSWVIKFGVKNIIGRIDLVYPDRVNKVCLI